MYAIRSYYGFVFNFITYGGHQIDGLAGEEFAAALRQDGMLALARLQRTGSCADPAVELDHVLRRDGIGSYNFV